MLSLSQMFAAMADRSDCVDLLIKAGARISAQDVNGQCALHWAALNVRVTMAKIVFFITTAHPHRDSIGA